MVLMNPNRNGTILPLLILYFVMPTVFCDAAVISARRMAMGTLVAGLYSVFWVVVAWHRLIPGAEYDRAIFMSFTNARDCVLNRSITMVSLSRQFGEERTCRVPPGRHPNRLLTLPMPASSGHLLL